MSAHGFAPERRHGQRYGQVALRQIAFRQAVVALRDKVYAVLTRLVVVAIRDSGIMRRVLARRKEDGSHVLEKVVTPEIARGEGLNLPYRAAVVGEVAAQPGDASGRA